MKIITSRGMVEEDRILPEGRCSLTPWYFYCSRCDRRGVPRTKSEISSLRLQPCPECGCDDKVYRVTKKA